MKQKSLMKKRLNQLLHLVHVYMDEFMNLQLVTRKAQGKQRKTLINAIFPTVKLKWEILSYYITTEDRKGRKFSFAWLGHYIISKITPKGVTTLKK